MSECLRCALEVPVRLEGMPQLAAERERREAAEKALARSDAQLADVRALYVRVLNKYKRLTSSPAEIRECPPDPATSRRYWEVFCPVCGIREGLTENRRETWLEALRDRHNMAHRETPLPPG